MVVPLFTVWLVLPFIAVAASFYVPTDVPMWRNYGYRDVMTFFYGAVCAWKSSLTFSYL